MKRWIRVTWLGWLAGIPAIALLALLGEAVRLGGAQVWVGAGMGLAVGFIQGRSLRKAGIQTGAWTLATTMGLAIPFGIVDLVHLLGRDLPYYLLACVASGGLGAGVAQARLLPSATRLRRNWVLASGAGWLLASAAAWSADALFRSHRVAGVSGALLYLGLIACGGLLLGLFTSPVAAEFSS